MLLFRCEFTHNEFTALKNYLPTDDYCIVGEPGESEYYGVIRAGLHARFMDILSGETLERLEYVDDVEMRDFLKHEGIETTGNVSLLDKFR